MIWKPDTPQTLHQPGPRQKEQAGRVAAEWRFALAIVMDRARLGLSLARRDGRLRLDLRIERGNGFAKKWGSNGQGHHG